MSATLSVPQRHAGPARTRTHRNQPAGGRAGARMPARTTARGYARRRALAGGMSATLVAVALVVSFDALSGASVAPASASAVQPASGRSVVARPGDTLWSIAGEHRGDVAIRRYLDALIDLNGGASILAGQRVQLP